MRRPWDTRALTVACVVLGALWVVGLAEAQPQSGIVRPTAEPKQPSLQLGAQLYAGNCASCHGIAGAGITHPRPGSGGIAGQGPALRGVGAQAADFYLRSAYMPLSRATEQPDNDRQNEKPLFNDKEIRSMVAYVASLGKGPPVPKVDEAAGHISDGQHLFAMHCAGCHQIEARGGFVTGAYVPPLQNVSSTQIAEAVRIGPYVMPRFSRAQISDAELNSIIRYVRSTRTPPNHGGWGIGNIGPIPEGLVTWWIAAPMLLLGCLLVSRRLHR